MCKSAFVTKLAVPFNKPCTGFLLTARFGRGMGERAGGASSAGPNFEELAWYVRKIFRF